MNIQMSAVKKRITQFPITRTVVRSGVEFHPTLNRGDKIRCYYCNKVIKVNDKTAFTVPNDPTKMQYIECPECEKRVSVLYYFDRKVKVGELKKKKTRKRIRAYVADWDSPDAECELRD